MTSNFANKSMDKAVKAIGAMHKINSGAGKTTFTPQDEETERSAVRLLDALRKMKKVNVPEGASGGTFKFKVHFDEAGDFVLPLTGNPYYDEENNELFYNYNFTVNWGDETPETTVTAFDSPGATHSFAAGTWIITLTGTCEYFSAENFGSPPITELVEFTGDMGFKVLDFGGCSTLTTIIPLGTMASLTAANDMFLGTGITTIPTGLFDNCPNITDFAGTFYGCQNITVIPADLFKYNTNVNRFASTFNNCPNITAIPTDLFKYNTVVDAINDVFGGCTGITAIPADLFKYNTAVRSLGGIFSNCSGITSIPADLFQYNPDVGSFSYAFQGTSITAIPAALFQYNVNADNFRGVFAWCTGINTDLPADLFLNNVVVTNFEEAFDSCSNMTGLGQAIIDNTALPGHTTPQSTGACFSGCTSLTDLATIPTTWGGLAETWVQRLDPSYWSEFESGEWNTSVKDVVGGTVVPGWAATFIGGTDWQATLFPNGFQEGYRPTKIRCEIHVVNPEPEAHLGAAITLNGLGLYGTNNDDEENPVQVYIAEVPSYVSGASLSLDFGEDYDFDNLSFGIRSGLNDGRYIITNIEFAV